jgi:hypothetical protein
VEKEQTKAGALARSIAALKRPKNVSLALL